MAAETASVPMAVNNSTAVEEKIAQCLKMLSGTTDEHKIAGLLMITKLGDLPAEQYLQVRREVLTTVGVSFFMRLLHKKGPDDVETLSSFQSLGLNLIASFCVDPIVATKFAQEKLVRFLLEQLVLQSTPYESFMDCICILSGFSQTEKGQQVMIHGSVLGRFFSTMKKLSRSRSNRDLAAECKSAEQEEQLDALLGNLWGIVGEMASKPELWTRIHSYDFEFICSNFSRVRGNIAVQVLSILNSYMRLIEIGGAPAELLSSQCLSDIRTGVLRFLRAKWPHQERDECLRLIFQLMQHSGTAWMLPGTTLRSQAPPEEVSDGKFILFLLKLVSIEIKIMLDEVEVSLVQIDESKVESIEETMRRTKEIKRVLALLPICYGIVEMVISGLVSNYDSELVLPYDILLEMKGTFNQIFVVVLELLTLVRDYVQTQRYRELRESHAESVYHLDAVICASIRIVSAWIAENSDTSMDLVIQLVPFMVCYKPLLAWVAQDATQCYKSESSQIVDSDDEIDSDDEVDAVSQMMQQAAVIHKTDSSIDQLHFLLPGLLQLSALPDGASIMSENVDVLRRLMQFCCTTCADIADGNTEFANVSTLTLCLGILINLILIRGGNESTGALQTSGVPNALEWFRALTFLLPVACASGSRLMADKDLTVEHRGEDDRYVMLLHVVCVVMFIVSHFQDKKCHPCRLPAAIASLVTPFNCIADWIVEHPPDAKAESTTDLFELMRVLSMRSILTPELLSQ
ncbi:unnamed protein product [Peronospora belbahrii]|uniref:Neurochondrin n=1 Tax=Peronospora belbahrii TaxID=622444 RepID=A0AAU9L0E9_9STRA|nr:unnamed protein product [Peronospora belbahrii]CAH0516758.1 unnamed protein product [Peronospora belbahrii]